MLCVCVSVCLSVWVCVWAHTTKVSSSVVMPVLGQTGLIMDSSPTQVHFTFFKKKLFFFFFLRKSTPGTKYKFVQLRSQVHFTDLTVTLTDSAGAVMSYNYLYYAYRASMRDEWWGPL